MICINRLVRILIIAICVTLSVQNVWASYNLKGTNSLILHRKLQSATNIKIGRHIFTQDQINTILRMYISHNTGRDGKLKHFSMHEYVTFKTEQDKNIQTFVAGVNAHSGVFNIEPIDITAIEKVFYIQPEDDEAERKRKSHRSVSQIEQECRQVTPGAALIRHPKGGGLAYNMVDFVATMKEKGTVKPLSEAVKFYMGEEKLKNVNYTRRGAVGYEKKTSLPKKTKVLSFNNYRYGNVYDALYKGKLSEAFSTNEDLIPYYVYYYFARKYAESCLKPSERKYFNYQTYETKRDGWGYSNTRKIDDKVLPIDPVMAKNGLYYSKNYIWGLSSQWVKKDISRIFYREKCSPVIKKIRVMLIELGKNWEQDKNCRSGCQIRKLKKAGR